jgi:hypothetical protein
MRYEVELSDKKPAKKGSNDQPAGYPVGETGGPGPWDAPDVRGFKVEVISKS